MKNHKSKYLLFALVTTLLIGCVANAPQMDLRQMAASQPGIFSQMILFQYIDDEKFNDQLQVLQKDSNTKFFNKNDKILITHASLKTPKVAFVPDALQDGAVSKGKEVQTYGINKIKELLSPSLQEIKNQELIPSLKDNKVSDADYLMFVDFQVKNPLPRKNIYLNANNPSGLKTTEPYNPTAYVIISIWGKNDEKITQFITRYNGEESKFSDIFDSKSYQPAGLFERPILKAVEYIKQFSKEESN
jgi:hypothetical protein